MEDIVLSIPPDEAEEECVQIKAYISEDWRRSFEEVGIKVIQVQFSGEDPQKTGSTDERDFSIDRFSPGIDASNVLRQIRNRGFTSHRIYIEEYPSFALLVMECWKIGVNEMHQHLWTYIQRFLDATFEQSFVRVSNRKESLTLGRRRESAKSPDFRLSWNSEARLWQLINRKNYQCAQACA